MLIVAVKPKSKISLAEIKAELDKHNIYYEMYNMLWNVYKIDVKNVTELPEKLQGIISSWADEWETVEIDHPIDYDPANSKSDNWGLGRIDKVNNPYISAPYKTVYEMKRTGKGVNAYIIDSGVQKDHPEFEGRVEHIFNGEDDNGHGTHVAGTVGSKTYGVAKDVKILSVKVMGQSGSGTIDTIIKGIDRVIEHYKDNNTPAVANMSIGGEMRSQDNPMNDAVNEMIEAGIVTAVAAGNSGADLDDSTVFAPAEIYKALTVGASDIQDDAANFSNYGSVLDLFAPGVKINSTYPGSSTASLNGTSMASPHVAGAVALMLEGRNKLSSAKEVKSIHNKLVDEATKGKIDFNGQDKYFQTPNRLLNVSWLNEVDIPNEKPESNPHEEGGFFGFIKRFFQWLGSIFK